MSEHLDPSYARGILSVWNDVAPDVGDFYERWYMSQHFPERLGIPGFLRGRRYEAIAADRRYFTFYDLTHPDVLFSDAYLARMNAPTAWTETVMRSWSGMLRTVCERVRRKGDAIGGFAAVARWEEPAALPLDLPDRILGSLDDPSIVAVDLWRASARQNADTTESRVRKTPDGNITAAAIVETTRAETLEKIVAALPRLVAPAAPPLVGTYRLIALQDAPR